MARLIRARLSWLVVAVAAISCSGDRPGPQPSPTPGPTPNILPIPTPTPTPAPAPTSPTTAFLVGAGDVANCNPDAELGRRAEETAKLIDKLEGTVFAAGDLAYMNGSAVQFQNCYHPRWGRFKNRTRPAPGNHEYESPGAAPYYAYFGDLAGPPGRGFYSYNVGNWHILSLNSNPPGTPNFEQLTWLRQDLTEYRDWKCTLAYWHHPRFTSGPSLGGVMIDVWNVLYEYGADVVVNGHDHGFEHFRPQNVDGRPDPTRGIEQFVVGSGGAPLYSFGLIQPNSLEHLRAWGVIQFTLRSTDYDWRFIEAGTEATLAFNRGTCH